MTALLNRSLTIVRRSPGSTDGYGGEIAAETLVEAFGEMQQQRRDEAPAEGEVSDTRWLLVLPAGTDIDTGDAVIVDGQVFELVGAPWEARNPRTLAPSHVECTLRRTATADEESS